MFPSIENAKIFLCRQPTDMRKSYDTLAALASSELDEDPLSGALFVFLNRPRNRIKVLYYESGGFCLWMKRLEAGSFPLPRGEGKKKRQARLWAVRTGSGPPGTFFHFTEN